MTLFHIKGTPITGVAITIALLASIGGLVFGYDTGQISDILLMDDFKLRFATCLDSSDPTSCKFANARTGAIVGFFAVGTMIGSLYGGTIAESLGRRRSMWIACLVYSVGVVVQVSSDHTWAQYAAGRLIGGLGVGSLSVVVPMYQAETSPAVIRGTLTATYQLFITSGILIAYCVSIGTRSMEASGSWRTVIGIAFLWPMLLSLGMIFMPESPRWLIREGRLAEARTALARVYGVPLEDADSNIRIRQEVDEAHQQAVAERSLSASWLDCFRPSNKTLYRTILGIALQSLQQLTGANYFFYFGATIFQSVGIADSFVTQIILGTVNFVATIGGLYVMQKFGRRWPLIIGGLWMSVWLFVFASIGVSRDVQNDKFAGTLMIASACLFIVGFATTWAPGVWIIISESFAPRTRAKQCSLATASMWIWNFMISFFTPFITADIGYACGFVFAGCNLSAAIFVYMFLYESSDLTLEAVDQMYHDPKCKPWTSAKWSIIREDHQRGSGSTTPSFGPPEEKVRDDHSCPGSLPHLATA